MSRVTTREVTVTTTGSAGSAVGSARVELPQGILIDIGLNFSASAPNTTDTTIAFEDTRLGNILVVSNSSTDAIYHPSTAVHDAAGSAVAGATAAVVVGGYVTLALAQCDALAAALVATFRVLE